MGYFIGGMIGLALAIAITLYVICSDIKKSNDIGDSSGRLKDFGKLHVIIAEDDMRHNLSSELGTAILRQNLTKASETSMK